MNERIKTFWGINVIGYCLLITTIIHFHKLAADKDEYFFTYANGFMPYWVVMGRYLFSWFQRVIGLICAIGLFYQKEFSRQLTIGLGFFAVATIYWKHPYIGVKNHYLYLSDQFSDRYSFPVYNALHINDPEVLHIVFMGTVIVLILWDVIFWVSVVKYLTHPQVKAQFNGRPIVKWF